MTEENVRAASDRGISMGLADKEEALREGVGDDSVYYDTSDRNRIREALHDALEDTSVSITVEAIGKDKYLVHFENPSDVTDRIDWEYQTGGDANLKGLEMVLDEDTDGLDETGVIVETNIDW